MRPSHPAPNTRDDREAPLLRARDGERLSMIFRKTEEKFSRLRPENPNDLNPLAKFVFRKDGFVPPEARRSRVTARRTS
jgi:hypothetical protein